MTLHEMASGERPKWGDERSDPRTGDAPYPYLSAELFEPALRDGPTVFFRRALHRNMSERCDTVDALTTTLVAGLAVPAAHGWADQRWRLDRVAVLIAGLFGEHYTQRGVSLLLHRLGWSPKASAHRAVERDEEAIATWARRDRTHQPPSAEPACVNDSQPDCQRG